MTTLHDVALLRVVAQGLAGPRHATPADVVRHLLAVQGQDLPGALVSVALRTVRPSPEAVVAAFDECEVVRTWPMRGTLHVVPAADVAWTVALMCARPLAAQARRRTQLGLTTEHLTRAEAVAAQVLAGTGATRAELMAAWAEDGVPTTEGRGYHLAAHLAQTGVVCQGPFRGTDQLFVLVEEWVPAPRRLESDEALAELARRFVVSHGPATDKDLARWSGLPLGAVRRGLAGAHAGGGQGSGVTVDLTTVEVDGVVHHLAADLPDRLADHGSDARRTVLLPGFDELVLGYADRAATVPPEHAARVVPGGNGVFRPTVVHEGVAVATWRHVGSGARRRIDLDPFAEVPAAVEREAEQAYATLP